MITEHDLEQAIAECQGERNPNANTCIKLAAFLTIQRELFQTPDRHVDTSPVGGYSLAPGPGAHTIDYTGVSEFSRLISGKDAATVWPVMDELMGTIQVMHPRLYDATMRKIEEKTLG